MRHRLKLWVILRVKLFVKLAAASEKSMLARHWAAAALWGKAGDEEEEVVGCTLSLSTLHRCWGLRHNKRLRTLFLPLPASEREAKSRQVKVRVGEDPSPATGLANYDQPAPPPASPASSLDLLHQPPAPHPAAGHLVRGRGWQGGPRPFPCSPVFLGDQWTWHLPSAGEAGK